MEILFIWLYNYKNFKEQGFNFSSEFIFNVEKDSKQSYKLKILKNKNFIPNFFEKSNILNVTAIIGQNGTGKSNILDFIKSSFPEGYSSIQSQAIIAYRSIENTEKRILLIPSSSFKVSVIQNETDFEVYKYPLDMPRDISGFDEQDYSNTEYVFYSNIFDLKYEEIDMAGIHNLSTMALLKTDTNEHDQKQLQASGGSYDSFKKNEIRRNIQFLLSDFRVLLKNFPLPEYLFILIRDNDLKYFQGNKHPDVKKILTFFSYELQLRDLSNETRLLNNLYISVFLNFLTTDREFSSLGGFTSDLTYSRDDTIKGYIIKFFLNLPNITYTDPNTNQEIPIINHVEKSKLAIEFFNSFEKLLNNKVFKFENEGKVNRSSIKYYINDESFEELTNLLDLYFKLKGLTDFLDFNWRNLSSGEQSMFTLLSRFYYLKHHKIQHDDLNKNMIILIDEGDVYFHPAWQKKFFQITLNYLSELFKDHNLQLIFTSNTPFITSDLPKSNVIFIEKISKNNVYVQRADNDRAETFGGNIHTLFSDSFYMEGALIGEFAKGKINKIFKYLTGDSKQKRIDYRKTIDIIGEPVLKRKMQEMWFQKFGIEEEIAELQKRIEELKKKRI